MGWFNRRGRFVPEVNITREEADNAPKVKGKGDPIIEIRYSELQQIKAKAEAYDELMRTHGTFLRRNQIIR